jgi:hypothetical protein
MNPRFAPILVSLLFAASGFAAEPPEGLEALFGAEEYRAMGLDKLSAEERARLERWLVRRLEGQPVPVPSPSVGFRMKVPVQGEGPESGGTGISFTVRPPAPETPAGTPVAPTTPPVAPAASPAPTETELFGVEQTDGGLREIRARVVGEFKGWDGKTEFALDNGQVWRQSTPGVYRFKATNPEIIVERSLIGYKLRLVETRRSINVRRVK